MIVSITGATGFIGRKLAQRHLERKDTVRVLTRQDPGRFPHSPEVQVYRGDLGDGDTPLEAFLDGADVLYHCAGELRDKARMRQVHVEGTEILLRAAQRRVARWVQLSSVGVYGPHREGVVTEKAAIHPVGEYETTKAAAEHLVIEERSRAGASWVVLRPSIVFGPGMPNQSLQQMIAMIDSGLFFFMGEPGASANYIHVDNVVEALMLCGLAGRASGGIYNLSDHLTIEHFVAIIARALDKPVPTLRVPEFLARWPASLAQRLRIRLPLTPSRIDALTSRAIYQSDRIVKELGYSPALPIEEGLVLFVKECRDNSANPV